MMCQKQVKKTPKTRSSKNELRARFWAPSGPSFRVCLRFLASKWAPGAVFRRKTKMYRNHVFFHTIGRVRRPQNRLKSGPGVKKRPPARKSQPKMPTRFSVEKKSVFGPLLGSGRDPKMASKSDPEKGDPIFGAHFCVFFAFSSLGRAPEGSRDRFWSPRVSPGPDFARIFRRFSDGSVGLSPWFAGFRRGGAGMHRPPPELILRGSPGVRRSRAAI